MSGVQHLLGRVIEGEAQRDAIHVAVAPVKAGERLYPGQHVGFANNGDVETVWAREKPIGLVDPYLTGPVQPGERFWLFLYPGSASVVRHDWTHPAFNPPPKVATPKDDAESKLREYGGSVDCPYDMLMDGARRYLLEGEYLIQGGRWEGAYIDDAFWDLYEIVTETKVPQSERGNFLSCSC